MESKNSMLDFKDFTPTFRVITSFGFGVLLSPYSGGLFFLIIWAIAIELFSFLWLGSLEYQNRLFLRISLLFWSFAGFMVGRVFCCGDSNPLRWKYNSK